MTIEYLEKSYSSLAKTLGEPFVLKDIRGRKGRFNYLIRNKKEFKKACQEAKDASVDFIAQEFIENEGDYRVIIFGKQIKLVLFRQGEPQSHLNNVSLGADASLIDEQKIPGHVKQGAINAADALKIDIAGVDMVQDSRTGVWYCLEVNEAPQLVSGSFIEEKREAFADFLTFKLQKYLRK